MREEEEEPEGDVTQAQLRKQGQQTYGTPSMPPPEPHPRQFLTLIGNTSLYLAEGEQPWTLPVEAMMLPTNSKGQYGRLGKALVSAIPGVIEQFQSALGTPPSGQSHVVAPAEPVAVPVRAMNPKDFLPTILIAATAWFPDQDKPSLEGASRAARAVIELAASSGIRRLGMCLLGAGSSGLPPAEVMRAMLASITAALPKRGLAEVTVFATEEEALAEARSLFNRVPQKFSNDSAGGEDLLDVSSEVQALTDILLLRTMQPPLAVGVLGGWGSGKSFAMHLMRQHIQRIRCEAVDPAAAWNVANASPYVGHIYPVQFDAWTYAKSNLWASLMQAIFLELSRQVGLEQRIREQLERTGTHPPELEGRLWLAMQDINDADRATLLQQPNLAAAFSDLSKASAPTQPTEGSTLWTALATLKEKQQKILDEKENEKAKLAAELETKKAEITRKVDSEIQAKAGSIALAQITGTFKDTVLDLVARVDGGRAAIADGKGVLKFIDQTEKDAAAIPIHAGDYLKAMKRNPVLTITGILGLLVPVALGVGFACFQQHIAAGVAWTGTMLGILAGIARTATAWREQLASVGQGLAKEVRKAAAALDEERKSEVQKALTSATPDGRVFRALEDKHQEVASEVERLKEQVGVTADYVSLAELVSARVKKSEYEGELGLMHRVQRDLRELSDALTLADGHPNLAQLKKHFPRGPARIVLFVDDLDRCPPDRVVEVLEATQLLVKTSLFVVVLALDVRYVTRALEKVYKDILTRRGNPCGLDYIEKIIQLPYSIRPVDRTHLDRFLTGHMDVEEDKKQQKTGQAKGGSKDKKDDDKDKGGQAVAVSEPLTAQVVRFTADDLKWVIECCKQVPLTPRAIKRILNAFKLLKIIWSRPNRHPNPADEVKEAFVALLCLSAKYPHAMRHLFERASQAFDSGKDVSLLTTMEKAIETLAGQCSVAEQEGIQRDLKLIPSGAKLKPNFRPTFELVRSLSFVAEIGYNPQDDAPSSRARRRSAKQTKAAGK